MRVATVDREYPDRAETIEAEGAEASGFAPPAEEPSRARWADLASLVLALAVIVAVCKGIQQLLNI